MRFRAFRRETLCGFVQFRGRASAADAAREWYCRVEMEADQRRATRYDVHLVVRYASAAEFVADYVENLSSGGLFVAGAQELPFGQECEVEIVLPGQGTWKVRARVVFTLSAEQAAASDRSAGAGMEVLEKPEGFDDALLGYLLRLGRRRDFVVMMAPVPGEKAVEKSGYQVVPLADPASIARMAEADPQFIGLIVPAADVEGYRELLRNTPMAERVFGVGSAREILDAIACIDSFLV